MDYGKTKKRKMCYSYEFNADILKINPFENETCPSGGWRSHCPRKAKCMYNHRDDPPKAKVTEDESSYRKKLRAQKSKEIHRQDQNVEDGFVVLYFKN